MELFKTLKGFKFNELTKGKVFVKILNEINYKPGLNVDIIKFKLDSECINGGLYFYDIIHFYKFIKCKNNNFAYVTIPDDANVYVKENEFKCNKIILSEIYK